MIIREKYNRKSSNYSKGKKGKVEVTFYTLYQCVVQKISIILVLELLLLIA